MGADSKIKWHHKDLWHWRDINFCVEIRRWFCCADQGKGPHRWAVYAYIYSQHPLFAELDKNGGIFQEAMEKMPLHGSCTYFRCHQGADGRVHSFQIGADYDHIYDKEFTHMATLEDAAEVRRDAENLIEWLRLTDGSATDGR